MNNINDVTNDQLDQKLQALYAENQPDAHFADQLEQQLRRMHTPPAAKIRMMSPHFIRRLGMVAASLVLMLALVTQVAPLRTLAEEVIKFFVPSYGYSIAGNENAYADVVTVDTVTEAEAIAGFDALEWLDGGFTLIHVSAAEGYTHLTYARENDHGVLMILSQWRTGSRPMQTPIDSDADVIHTQIHGVDAQFVAGAPFGEPADWLPHHYRQLRWEADGMSYHLRLSSPIARTVEQTVAIAEALR